MPVELVSYLEQSQTLPCNRRYIVGQHKQGSILVYAAFKNSIANSALAEQQFISGCGFKYSRYSWLKPSFLWLMHCSDWARKNDQERILAIRIKVDVFEALLTKAVSSHFDSTLYTEQLSWKKELKVSNAIYQMGPDYTASGKRLDLCALQLGLRSIWLKTFNEGIINIFDMTNFVREQCQFVEEGNYTQLLVPKQSIYQPKSMTVRLKLKLDW